MKIILYHRNKMLTLCYNMPQIVNVKERDLYVVKCKAHGFL